MKRQKFLERNRAAASRCRAKKKVWIENLEKKSKEIEVLNQSLQQEVVMLRSEVQQLKSILIAHKDCPLIVHQTNKGIYSLFSISFLFNTHLAFSYQKMEERVS